MRSTTAKFLFVEDVAHIIDDELLDQPPRQTKERREHNGKTKATRKAAGQ